MTISGHIDAGLPTPIQVGQRESLLAKLQRCRLNWTIGGGYLERGSRFEEAAPAKQQHAKLDGRSKALHAVDHRSFLNDCNWGGSRPTAFRAETGLSPFRRDASIDGTGTAIGGGFETGSFFRRIATTSGPKLGRRLLPG